ncbi:DUF2381 family protein [Corallococcus sicarius]|uniref:DUF2381 family protein n=1 Tax=Corallococcus sicarius TaxID=2316726 RepID=A0A3A8NUH4_9BACT|nr:DUF2381 family protein [Corallococcus sicarius]RKH43672.1 DUF2381 family protein [Corallococcus sicarius]
MLLVSRPLLLLSFLLLGTDVIAQEAPRGRELTQRRVTLSRSVADTPVELHVAPGFLTALEFDAPVDRDAVTSGNTGLQFALFEVNSRSIVLRPTGEFTPGERVLLTVPFADGMSPARAVFALVWNASQVDVQVQVLRLPRTAEAVQAELDEVRAACAGKDAELEVLRTRNAATGPSGMILTGTMDVDGVQAKDLLDKSLNPTDGLKVERVTAFRGTGWVALSLAVTNEGTAPWTPTEARLFSVGGGRSRAATVALREPHIAPGEKARVVVETRGEDWPEDAALRVELRDSTGARRLLIPSLVF